MATRQSQFAVRAASIAAGAAMLLSACGGAATPAASTAPASAAASSPAAPASSSAASSTAASSTGAAASAASSASAGSAASLAGTEVKIGVILPQSGPLSNFGKKNILTVQMAANDVNAAGGVEGKKLVLVTGDSASKPDQAALLVKKMAGDDKVLAILGPLGTGEAQVTFPVCNQLKIVCVSNASSLPGVAKANRPWAFRNTLDDGILSSLGLKAAIKDHGVKKVVLAYDSKDGNSANLGSKIWPQILKDNNIQIVNAGSPITFQTDDSDFSATVTKLKAAGQFDAIALAALAQPAALFLKELRRQGVTQPVIGTSQLMGQYIITQGGKDAEGVYSGATYYPGQTEPPSVVAWEAKDAAALKAGGQPAEPEQFDANIYDEVMLTVAAIKSGKVTNDPAKLEADRTAIRDFYQNTHGFQGVAGKIGFTADGEGEKTPYAVKVSGGKWVAVPI